MPSRFFVSGYGSAREMFASFIDDPPSVERIEVWQVPGDDDKWEVQIDYVAASYHERLENGDCEE